MADWRDDLKKILMASSFNLNHTVFLFSDAQVSGLIIPISTTSVLDWSNIIKRKLATS